MSNKITWNWRISLASNSKSGQWDIISIRIHRKRWLARRSSRALLAASRRCSDWFCEWNSTISAIWRSFRALAACSSFYIIFCDFSSLKIIILMTKKCSNRWSGFSEMLPRTLSKKRDLNFGALSDALLFDSFDCRFEGAPNSSSSERSSSSDSGVVLFFFSRTSL